MLRAIGPMLLAAYVALLTGCGDDDGETAMTAVVVEGVPELVSRIDTVRLSITLLAAEPATGRVIEIPAEHMDGRMSPITRRLLPEPGARHDAVYRILAEGLIDGRPIISARHRLTFLTGRVLTVTLRFTQACVEVACSVDTTCIAGACVSDFVPACVFDPDRDPSCPSPFEPPPMDAAVAEDAADDAPSADVRTIDDAARLPDAEASIETSVPDAGPLDAGRFDASLLDASNADGSLDGSTGEDARVLMDARTFDARDDGSASTDAAGDTVDGGVDAGCACADAGLPPCRVAYCPACVPTITPDLATCDDGDDCTPFDVCVVGMCTGFDPGGMCARP